MYKCIRISYYLHVADQDKFNKHNALHFITVYTRNYHGAVRYPEFHLHVLLILHNSILINSSGMVCSFG